MIFTNFTRAIVTAGLLGCVALSAATTARASDYCAPACRYATVTEYVRREVPYTRVVTLYDECGRPYRVEVSGIKTVRCPVTRRVLICD